MTIGRTTTQDIQSVSRRFIFGTGAPVRISKMRLAKPCPAPLTLPRGRRHTELIDGRNSLTEDRPLPALLITRRHDFPRRFEGLNQIQELHPGHTSTRAVSVVPMQVSPNPVPHPTRELLSNAEYSDASRCKNTHLGGARGSNCHYIVLSSIVLGHHLKSLAIPGNRVSKKC